MTIESVAGQCRRVGRTGPRPAEYAPPQAHEPRHRLALVYGIAVLIIRAPLWLSGRARR
ncbi:MAG TPA: hypothetical protein VGH33_13345 [Isosphaeraceae bacterium]